MLLPTDKPSILREQVSAIVEQAVGSPTEMTVHTVEEVVAADTAVDISPADVTTAERSGHVTPTKEESVREATHVGTVTMAKVSTALTK